jgi:DNA-binding MarR family transcriptional regulator
MRFISVPVTRAWWGKTFSALTRLGRGEVSTASALATAEHVRPQSMAVTLAALERMGLIMRTPDQSDGRRQIIIAAMALLERLAS